MEKSTELQDELQLISPMVASLEKVNVFTAPAGYFNGLEEKILAHTLLHQNEKKEGWQIPEGYFDTLSTKILDKIKNETIDIDTVEEEQPLSPLLMSLKDKNVFTVPDGYFENVSGKIVSKAGIAPKAKVISITAAKKQWWKYAAAAVIAGTLTITSVKIFKDNPVQQVNPQITTVAADVPDYVKLSYQYKTPEELNAGIASLSDEDIINYLEKTGNITDDDILINGTDPQELPAPDEYLIDDNTLNKYLDKIGAGESKTNPQ